MRSRSYLLPTYFRTSKAYFHFKAVRVFLLLGKMQEQKHLIQLVQTSSRENNQIMCSENHS